MTNKKEKSLSQMRENIIKEVEEDKELIQWAKENGMEHLVKNKKDREFVKELCKKMMEATFDKTMKKVEEEVDNELEDVNKKINEYLEQFGKGKNRNINIGEKIVLTTLPEIITDELKQKLGLKEINKLKEGKN